MGSMGPFVLDEYCTAIGLHSEDSSSLEWLAGSVMLEIGKLVRIGIGKKWSIGNFL